MANFFPLIINPVGNVIQELPATDFLDLSQSGIANSGNITVSGVISATGNVTAGNVSGTTGAFSTVTGNGRALTSLNASNMDTGTLPAARLSGAYTISVTSAGTATSATTAGTVTTAAQPTITSVGTLTSVAVTGNVTAGNFVGTLNGSGANVSSINGTNISSGTVAAARIAALDAAKVTTGVFADARIPNLNASKITAGTLAVARGGTGVTTSTGTGAVVLQTSPSFVTQITVPAIAKSGTTGVGNIGAAGSTFDTVFAKATSAQYADVAERYQADADYAPGTVLVIGGTHEVTTSTVSHDHRAAGVVSENPSYLMNSALDTVNSVSVALLGRVPCQVIGPIDRGDLLTTSEVPGTAGRLDPAKYLPGCVIGKALQDYHSEQPGTIEIAVGVK